MRKEYIISSMVPWNQEKYAVVCVLIENINYSLCQKEASSEFTYMDHGMLNPIGFQKMLDVCKGSFVYMCVLVRERGRQRWRRGRGEGEREGGAVSQNLLLCSREGQKVHPMSPLIHTFVCCYCCLVAQFCSALVIPWTVSLPISSVHGIFWARLRGWVAISFFRASFNPGIEPTFLHLLHYKWILYHWATREAPVYILYQNNHPYTGKKNFPILAKTTNCMENTYSWVSFLVS